ncbi:MAG: tubulin-like doman-containing protein [Tannerella sp.]|jgi:hypothetical protein|nr:tubulin-like doman-containing protein [Tannerella sp.]
MENKIKLRPSLYIGLGGTGMKAVLNTKKLFIETYGEKPPMIGFLGIDTNVSEFNTTLPLKNGKFVQLDKPERIKLTCDNPVAHYEYKKYKWMPRENVPALRNLSKYGAGQVRTNGRISVFRNKGSFGDRLERDIDALMLATKNIDNNKFELIGTEPDIHLVFSVCGGTGAGTFIDIAYLINEIKDQSSLIGYAVLPGVFKAMNPNNSERVRANAYGSIKDLDYLVSVAMDKLEPVEIGCLKNPQVQKYPFSSMIFIDNTSTSGYTYDDINQLSEVISIGLFASATASGDNINSKAINTLLEDRSTMVENKYAWISGYSAAMLSYRSEDLAKVYSMKSAQQLIQNILSESLKTDKEDVDSDPNKIANIWIDNAKIRENNSHDDLINQLININEIEISNAEIDVDTAKNTMDDYINDKQQYDNQMKIVEQKVRKEVAEQLDELVLKYMNKSNFGNVGTTLLILSHIKSQINIFVEEMESESEKLASKTAGLQSELAMRIKDLEQYANKKFKNLFTKSETYENLYDAIKLAAQEILKNKLEIARRGKAKHIFGNILIKIEETTTTIETLQLNLKSVENELTEKISRTQNYNENSLKNFEIDLAENEIKAVIPNHSEIIITHFIAGLANQSLLDIIDKNTAKSAILAYTDHLPGTENWKKRTIDDALNRLSENQDEFDEEIKRLILKSESLLKIDDGGRDCAEGGTLEDKIKRDYLVVVPDEKNSLLAKDGYFKDKLLRDDRDSMQFVTDPHLKRNILIYRKEGTIPAYAINSLNSYIYEYEHCTISTHFDEVIRQRMKQEMFDIQPKAQGEDENLHLWVLGQVFKLIKYNREHYWYSVPKKETFRDASSDEYYVKMSGTTHNNVYSEFIDKVLINDDIRKHFESSIDKEISKMGDDKWDELKNDLKQNYATKYLQCHISYRTMKAGIGYKDILSLYNKEKYYIDNKLV